MMKLTYRLSLALFCVAAIAASAPADLIITEIMYDPGSTLEGDWEYVEIYNNGATPVDLTGYVVDDSAGVLGAANVAAGTVPALGTAVLIPGGTLSAMQAAWGNSINFVEITGSLGLNNSGVPADHIGIWSSFASYGAHDVGTAVDLVEYGSSTPWPGAGGNSSIYLTDVTLDNSVATNWARSTDGVSTAYVSAPAGENLGTNVGSPGLLPGGGPLPDESCCFPTGACGTMRATECTRFGGTPGGPGSTCATANCQPSGSGCPGDLNNDQQVNGSDIAPFIQAVLANQQCP